MTLFEEYINLLSDNVISDKDKEYIIFELLEELHPKIKNEGENDKRLVELINENNYAKLYDYTISKYPEMKQYEFIDPNKKIVNIFEIFAEHVLDDCQDELYYLFDDCKDLIDLFYEIKDEDDLRWNIEFDVLKQEKIYNLYSYMKAYDDCF